MTFPSTRQPAIRPSSEGRISAGEWSAYSSGCPVRLIQTVRKPNRVAPATSQRLDDWKETGSSNIFMVKDGHIFTPTPNGTFLAGITRSRVMSLLADYGFRTTEKTLSVRDFMEADELFSTGNHSKVVPITRIEERHLQPGPVAQKARELYWDWAHSAPAN